MSVVQSIEDVGPSRKQLRIEVPAPAVDAETERVVREYGRSLKLPGFRPGKVPTGVVRQRFREEIDREVVERLVPRYWREAQSEAGLEPITEPRLAGVDDRESGEPLVFTAQVEVRPEIEVGDLGGLTLPEPPEGPTDEEVQEALEELRRRAGDWVPVDRPAAQGDRVPVEISEVRDDEASGEGEAPEPDTIEVEVGSPRIWEELSVALTGLSEGQKGEFDRMEDEGGEVRKRSFRFRVLRVEERELPELDDELAQEIGGFESVDELRQAVRERLAEDKRAEGQAARERALLDQLRERHPLEVPEGLVNEEMQGLVREYAESLARQGVDLENAELDWSAVAEEAKPAAEKRVHARLVLDAVARKLDLSVGEDELEATLARFARNEGVSAAQARRALERDGRLEGVRAQLLRAKTVRHLLGEDEGPEDGKSEAAPAVDTAGTESGA
ncbi:MAG: trigger factor [bacterium]